MIRYWQVASFCIVGLVPAFAYGRSPTHVACLGDSITVGVGASDGSKSWVALLQNKLGNAVSVQNFGVSGATMLTNGDKPYENEGRFSDAKYFVEHLTADDVVDVVIMFGSNDSKPYNWTPDGKPKQDVQFTADYKTMIQTFAAMPSKPLIYVMLPPWAGPTPCCDIKNDVIHDDIVPAIKAIADEYTLAVIDLNTPFQNQLDLLGSDQVHPNDAGNAKIADLVYQGLGAPPPQQMVGGAGSVPATGGNGGNGGAGGASAGAGGAAAAAGAGGSTSASGGSTSGAAGSRASGGTGSAGAPTAGTSSTGTAGLGFVSGGSNGADSGSTKSSGCAFTVDATPAPTWLGLSVVGALTARARRRRARRLSS